MVAVTNELRIMKSETLQWPLHDKWTVDNNKPNVESVGYASRRFEPFHENT